MKNSYFSAVTSRIYCYFGEIFDLFIDELLTPSTLPEMLHLDLKRQGYERIVFFGYTEGAFFLDAASKESFRGKSAAPRLRGATRGRLLSADRSPAAPPARQDALSFDIGPAEMIRYAARLMSDASVKTAVIFSDGLNLLENLQREGDGGSMLNDLFRKIESINDIRNRNVMILLFDRSESGAAEFFHGQKWTYVWESLKARAVFHHIPPPSAQEIRCALNHLRLAGVDGKRLRVDLTPLPEMCRMIAGKIQRNINAGETGAKYTGTEELAARQMKSLLQHLMDHFITPERELTLDACERMCTKKAGRPAIEQLRELVGMQQLKDKLEAYIRQNASGAGADGAARLRLEPPARRTEADGPNLNFILTGKKGTGKSTAARLIGEILGDCGLLPSGHLVETRPSKLIGQYVGHSEANMRDAIERARGGVLFIDEAYGFAAGSRETNSYHTGMVNELVAGMTADKGAYAVVLAGYPEEMEHMLRTVNPGLKERFANRIHIEDYTPEELTAIFRKMARAKGFTLSSELDGRLTAFFDNWHADQQNDWANARNAENLLNDMAAVCRDGILTGDMLPQALKRYYTDEEQRSVRERLDAMIGLAGVKQTICDFENEMRYGGHSKRRNYHFVFAGNPGTGKTTIAEIFGQLLKGAGVLKSGTVCKVEAGELMKQPDALSRAIRQCRDRVLFIDEAYQLLNAPHLIDQLVEKTNPDAADFPFCAVCAGYEEQMRQFMEYNAGMERRFSVIHFDTYTPEDLLQILEREMKARYPSYAASPDFFAGSLAHFREYERQIAKKYNGGYIGRYLEEVKKILYRGLHEKYGDARPPAGAYRFTAAMIPDRLV